MKVESVRQSVVCICPFSFILWVMGPLLGGQGLRPASLRSDGLIGKRKWGHGSALESFFPSPRRLKGNPDYRGGPVLLFMHAVGFHCPSCATNCGMRIGQRLLEAACGKTTYSSLFMSGS